MDKNDTQIPYVLNQYNYSAGSVKQRHLVPSPTQPAMMYYGLDGNSFQGLTIGTSGQILMVVNGFPAWVNLAPPSGLAASRPTAGTFVGQQYFASDSGVLSIWNGSTWLESTFV